MESIDKLFVKTQSVASLEDSKGMHEAYHREYCGLIGFYERLVEDLYVSHPEARRRIDQVVQRRIDICDMLLEKG